MVSGSPARYGRRWAALVVLCVSLLIVTLDNTVLNVVLPTLVRELHATTSQMQWIVDSYVIVFAGLLLPAGSVADRLGRKRVFLTGLIAFAAGSTWAAFSGSVGMLIAARASMGIGGALIMPATLSIITNIFSDRGERQRAIGMWAGTTGAGVALGPIIGGLLLAHFWWGSVFLINVPLAVLGFACALPLVPDSRNEQAARPDLAGTVLSIAGLGLVLWALIEAPVEGWSSGLVIGAGVAGLAVLVAFAFWERASTHPMLNLDFFRRRQFSAAIGSVGLMTFGLFGALFLLTQFLQFSIGYTPLEAGVRVLPAAGAIAIVAPLSAPLVRFIGTKFTAAAGMLIVAGGLWQISGSTLTTTYLDILPGLIMLGVGAGLVIPSATASVMGSVPPEHTGVGSATNGAFLQVGGALGVAVLGSLLSTRYQGHMTAALAPYHVPPVAFTAILGSLGGALAVAAQAGGVVGTELASLAKSAFASGMDLALTTAAVVSVAGCLIMLVALPSWHAAPTATAPSLTPADDPAGQRPGPGRPGTEHHVGNDEVMNDAGGQAGPHDLGEVVDGQAPLQVSQPGRKLRDRIDHR
jgi:EmrB/QacA subfamily drug resistance transporter